MSCITLRNNECTRCIGPEVDECKQYYSDYKQVCTGISDFVVTDIKDFDNLTKYLVKISTMVKQIKNCIHSRDIHTTICIEKNCQDKGHDTYLRVITKTLKSLQIKQGMLEMRLRNLGKNDPDKLKIIKEFLKSYDK